MRKQSLQQKLGVAVLQNQNFIAYDRGDMFVPAGFVSAPINVASMATPRLGVMPAHSIPVAYTLGKKRFSGGPIGLTTPNVGVSPNGS